MYSNEQCHPAKIYQACACTKPCMFLPDDRANARTSKKSLICEMHCGVYTIIYNDYACVIPYPKYIQEKRIKLAKEHMVDIEEVGFYVLSSPFLAEL